MSDCAADTRADEVFNAVLDDLSVARLNELARATVLYMNRKELFYQAYMSISGMTSKEKLELIMNQTPNQYAICVLDSGVNKDLHVTGIPERGA